MKTPRLVLAASATALLLTLTPTRDAHALGPIDLEVAAKAGYGSHDLGFGIGGRAGVSIFGIYAGLNIVDYLGQSEDGVTPHFLTYGGEVGFGFKISHLIIRPLIGFGNATESISSLPSASAFYLEPGGLVALKFGLLLVGVDAGCFIIPSEQSVGGAVGSPVASSGSSAFEAFTIHGQVGVSF